MAELELIFIDFIQHDTINLLSTLPQHNYNLSEYNNKLLYFNNFLQKEISRVYTRIYADGAFIYTNI